MIQRRFSFFGIRGLDMKLVSSRRSIDKRKTLA